MRSALPSAVSDDGSRVLIKARFFDDNDTYVRQFFTYDIPTNSVQALAFTHAISHDSGTVALVAVDERGVETIAVLRAVGAGG